MLCGSRTERDKERERGWRVREAERERRDTVCGGRGWGGGSSDSCPVSVNVPEHE